MGERCAKALKQDVTHTKELHSPSKSKQSFLSNSKFQASIIFHSKKKKKKKNLFPSSWQFTELFIVMDGKNAFTEDAGENKMNTAPCFVH